MENPLLQNPLIYEKYKKFSKENYQIKQQVLKRRAEALSSNIEFERKNNNPDSLYRCALKVYPNLKEIQKIYAYVSCLNTGKLKTINPEKLTEYHILFDDVKKRYYADKEYIKLVNSS